MTNDLKTKLSERLTALGKWLLNKKDIVLAIFSWIGGICVAILFVSIIVIVFSAIYSEIALPDGIDQRQFWEGEGPAFDTLDISLIISEREESQGRRVVVLNTGWGFVTRKSFDHKDGQMDVIPVSQNFKSDFASIPFPANRIIDPFGKHAEAAVIHDWLYALGRAKAMSENDRKFADIIFYDAMRRLEVNWLRRRVMYTAVRLGGSKAFKKVEGEWNDNFFDPLIGQNLESSCVIPPPDSIFPKLSSRSKIIYAAQRFFGPKDKKFEELITEINRYSLGNYGRNYFNEEWRKVYEKPQSRRLLLQGLTNRFDLEVGNIRKKMESGSPLFLKPLFDDPRNEDQLIKYLESRNAGDRIAHEALLREIHAVYQKKSPSIQ